ncbi:MAG: hypothetical protein IT547_00360 [Hyphomonadaceae bacterium]|nr:hypothetical protein [Hyphomonadaceae bacterium]
MTNESSVQLSAQAPKMAGKAPALHLASITVPSTEGRCLVLISDCLAQDRKVRAKLRQLASGSKHKLKKALRHYCRADYAKVAALTTELARDDIKVGGTKEKKWTAQRALEEARKLSVCGQSVGKVVIRPILLEEKLRPVFKFFDPMDRARQRLAHNALKAATIFPPWMFLFNGGERAAITWLAEHLPKARAILVTDVPSCFALLPWQMVENGSLLPRRAIRSLLFDPWKRAKIAWPGPERPNSLGEAFLRGAIGASNCADEIGAGRGLPPGAVLSPIVAQLVLQKMLAENLLCEFPGIEIGLLADNLVILLPDKNLATLVIDRLTMLALNHFDDIVAHEFRRRTDAFKPGEAFKYLGRLIRVKNKRVSMDPLPGHRERLFESVCNDLGQAKSIEDFDRPVRRMVGFASRHGGSPATTLTVMRVAAAMADEASRYRDGLHGLNSLLDP